MTKMPKTNVVQRTVLSPPDAQDASNSHIKTYAEIKEHYETYQCWGLASSIDAKNCDPELIRSADAIKEYVVKLCDLIDMKRFQDTMVVHFGEDEKVAGYSMVQLIETSLISGHFANLTNAIYIDIFSCKIYDPYQAAEFTRNFFKASDAAVNICFRK
jgi:S-adenosylmethionine/arginine decarboxylase-like enzyme